MFDNENQFKLYLEKACDLLSKNTKQIISSSWSAEDLTDGRFVIQELGELTATIREAIIKTDNIIEKYGFRSSNED